MEQFCMSTVNYSKEVVNFLKDNGCCIISDFKENDINYFLVKYNFLIIRDLSLFIEDLILDENPIVKSSPKLKGIIKRAIFKKKRNNINEDLYYLINNEYNINIDGYITFKLQKYTTDINNILYYLVKKNLYKLLTLEKVMI